MMTSDYTFGRDLPIGSHHYRAYVGPPDRYDLVAAMQFNLLTSLGLREFHFLLDIGCGSLRAGRLFIPYLLPAHYFGIEPEKWLVDEGLRNELGEDIIRIKRPTFSYNSLFNFSEFGQKFDFVVAQSIFSHASQAQIRDCLANVEKCLKPNGILAATFVQGRKNYEQEEWLYPECVTYTSRRMRRLVCESGLVAKIIKWHHPNSQTWILIRRRRSGSPWWLRMCGYSGQRSKTDAGKIWD
jgi:cyclopropane fatty-acyl-phospholipid synthase-like methyltransferase